MPDDHTVIPYLLEGGMWMKVGFIGAGKVGCSLGKYFVENGITVTGFYSRSLESSKAAADFTQTVNYETMESILEDSDTLFLTVPDGQIGKVWDYMGNLDIKNKVICHCSGSISSATFFHGEERGAKVYSVHPLYAISDKFESWKSLKNAYFVIEGTEDGLEEMKRLLVSCGNKVIVTKTSKKALYHGAAVTASNLVVGLVNLSAKMLVSCGFEKEEALEALHGLFLGNAQNIVSKGPVEALTGPVERKDISTVEKHLKAFAKEKEFENASVVYRLLSMELLEIAQEKHADWEYDDFMEVLRNEEYSDDI